MIGRQDLSAVICWHRTSAGKIIMGTYVTGKFGPPEKFGPPPGTNSVNTRTPGTYFTTTLDPTIWTTPLELISLQRLDPLQQQLYAWAPIDVTST